MPPSSDPAGNNFTKTLHHTPYPTIDPTLVTLPQPFAVCITGTSRGIGAHIAYSYARAGATSIAICSPTSSEVSASEIGPHLTAINPTIRFLNKVCDVTSDSSLHTFAETVTAAFGRLDVLVCNAGFWGAWDTRVESTPADFAQAFDVNCNGVYLASRHFLPLLLGSENGARALVSICSADMHSSGTKWSTAYCISKMASARLVEYLAAQHQGLFTAAVQPGAVKTEMARLAPREIYETMLIDDPSLCGSFLVWLTKERRLWLSGRYLAANWDVEELVAMKDEIVRDDKLKMRMVL